MNTKYIHILSIAVVCVGLGLVSFLYLTQPKTLAEVTAKGSVVIGTYSVDKAEYDRGLAAFRNEDYLNARAAFDRADPEKRDATTQFYVSYSYYRQGWGRFTNDDTLFKAGLDSVAKVIAIDPTFRTADPNLQIKTPLELKAEFEEGLKLTASDFNPMKLTRERK